MCVFVQHRKLELIHSGISLLYGARSKFKVIPISTDFPKIMDTPDLLAFSLTIYFITRSKKAGFKLTILLQTIAEDATQYFLFIFTSHLVLVLALAFGRVSTTALLFRPQRMTYDAYRSRNRSNFLQLQLRKSSPAHPQ